MIGYVAVLGLGYVLGAKAGRRRYEQIASTYRALTGSPVARSMIEGGRRKIANRISPDAAGDPGRDRQPTAVVQRGVERQPKTAR
ncbi:hypothetical protein J113_16225 [Mycobacterium tuberculosis CAS/NITR204]|uniref:Uncharacterized protein n=1 Tax=Mycobacterium tuberculosis CAS/NITR204 TaxID=1310114 RepID=R4MK01_MYCTX|nr:hypothetical protein J113_16225 [Mycobacterium tuberculosis CAS/NITR204]